MKMKKHQKETQPMEHNQEYQHIYVGRPNRDRERGNEERRETEYRL